MWRIRWMSFALVAIGIGGASVARANPYWVDWEGDDYPENQGWSHSWGNLHGSGGSGAIRTLSNGILTIDSRFDPGVYDFVQWHRPGAINPGPGEMFVVEWRLKVDEVDGSLDDPGMTVAGDGAERLAFTYTHNALISGFESGVRVPIVPDQFHTYRLSSSDMQTYELAIDGQVVRLGTLWQGVSTSYVGWGDEASGFLGGSLHEWDYFRFGVVPEPSSLVCAALILVGRRLR